ncbi:hypothetical protein HUT06_02225 [Actinomadura sp. NAK00032]|uniref:hypothetical protein n=1 Tax=Actinomadura sp. NAK00032 TaxID=2742128 RepID=UPI001590F6F7|nr:hypothetical protein [Actinomadura sp. NAK00032]QKW33002.1 hypothetical protein HUT06_02225 [Actinomadura sp. NAK00032]
MRPISTSVGTCLLLLGLVAAVFSLHNAYSADEAVDTGEPRCGGEVQTPETECVTSYGGPAIGGGVSYEEAKETKEDTAVAKAWIFGAEVLGTAGVALYAGAVVCLAGAVRSRRFQLPMVLAAVLVPAAVYGLAFWPAQERVREVSPVPPGVLSFLDFPYFPIVIISVAALTAGWAWFYRENLDFD